MYLALSLDVWEETPKEGQRYRYRILYESKGPMLDAPGLINVSVPPSVSPA